MITSTHGIVASQMTTFDANAWAFINAAGITNGTQRTAINNLVLSLKSANIWTKFTAIWPMVGGTATTHSYNLVNPAQYQISFVNSWSHSSTGATPTNASLSYANTGLNCSTALTASNNHMAFYSRSNTAAGSKASMGAYHNNISPFPIYVLSLKNSAGNAGAFNTSQATGQAALAANANSQGLYVSNKNGTAIGNLTLFKNGSQIAANTVAITINNYPNLNLYIGACSLDSSSWFQTDDKECAFSSVGTRFTSGELSTFYTIVQAYQTTLGRQV